MEEPHRIESRGRLPTLSPAAYRRITLSALVSLCVIVVSGTAVRLTGSGLGCPTWPNCEPGRLIAKDETDVHTLIEQGNRLFTGVVSVAVVLAVLGSIVRVPRRRDLTRWSWSLVAGVAAQIVLGGLTVLFELAPPFVIGHFLLSAVLVGCATVLHHRAGEPDDGVRAPTTTPELRRLVQLLVVSAATVLVTGTIVTGAGPHGGDEDVERLSFLVPDVVRIHAVAVWLLVAGTLGALWLAGRGEASAPVVRALRVLVVVEVAQGAIGYTQYFTGVPEGLVAVHVLGSMLVWIAAVSVLLRTTEILSPDADRADRPAGVDVDELTPVSP